MTEQEVLDLINEWIVANGVNSITADVLRPVLVAMLSQPNDYIGDLSTLNTAVSTDLVSAINEVNGLIDDIGAGFIKLHDGTDDPNTTPPATFDVADFYYQHDIDNNPLFLWQYDGFTWIKATDSLSFSITTPSQGDIISYNLSADVWENTPVPARNKGYYNATTNTPSLVDGTGTKGDYYTISVAGNQDYGSGSIDLSIRDRLEYDGSIYFKAISFDSISGITDVNFGNFINSLTEKTIPVSEDFFGIMNSEDSNKENKISWKNLMLSLKMAFNGDTYSVQSTGAALSTYGIATPTTVGSPTNVAANYSGTYASNPIAFCVHRSSSSGTGVGSSAEFYENTQKLIANGLGYFFHGKIAPTWVSGCANYLAITGSNAATGNVNPSSLIDFIGFGVDDSDVNLQFMHNDGSGTATKVDMGANFAIQGNNCYTFMIWNFYGSNDVYISILNLRNNAVFSATTNSDLPAITVGLAPHIWSGNRATTNNIAAKFSYYTIQRQH